MGLSETAGSPKYLTGIGDPAFFCRINRHRAHARQMETAMSNPERNTIGSRIKLLIPVVALALFTAPSASKAESFLLFKDPLPEAVRLSAKRPLDIGLNEKGDLVMRHGTVVLIMAYTPPGEAVEARERSGIIPRQDHSVSGISFKVSLLF